MADCVGRRALFAFPLLYASAFSGLYLALFMVLWLLILRGLAIELRHHVHHHLWGEFWDVIFSAASLGLALLFGVALERPAARRTVE